MLSRTSASLIALAVCCPTFAGEVAAGADLPVTAVTLFSSGVGWFQHAGTVHGDAKAELRFRTGQINDVLKSLVLEDLDGGTIGAVGYPSQDPLDKTLKSFQVDISGNPPLAALLNQLRGAQVQVQVLDSTVNGTVLGCESHVRALAQNSGSETIWVLNLLTEGAIRPIPLANVHAVKPTDPALAAELSKALAALAGARDQDKKPVSLTFRGNGARKVRLGYVAEAPVWKASYRLLLTGKDAHLQAWAIVENPTESDWTDVRLALVSGRPISFIQDLYRPLYATRPEVATELQAGLRPVAYGGGMDTDARNDQAALKTATSGGKRARTRLAPASAPMVAMEADSLAGGEASVGDRPFNAISSIQVATEAAGGVGELFTYSVGTVSIPRQRSAMIPFIGTAMQAERVSIYNRAVLPRNPLAGARLTNSTGNHLAPGPVTVYDDGTYAGDAQLTALPPGQVRLISFAVDQRLIIDSERERGDETRTLVRIVKGVLEVQVVNLRGRTYVADNQGDTDKKVIIEHPRLGGEWSLHETPVALETTDQLYRFSLSIPAKKKAELAVTERFVRSEGVGLIDANSDQIGLWLQGAVKPAVKEALAKVRLHVEGIATTNHAREETRRQIQAITEDQERIRRNVGTVERNSDYAKRLLVKLNDQETKLDQLRTQDEQLGGDLASKHKALADFVSQLSIE